MVRRVLFSIALLLLAGLAWLGLSGGLRQLPQSQGVGQHAQTFAQLAYGVLSVLGTLTAFWGRRWAPLVLAGWAASVTIAGGLAPVVWGGSGWPAGLVAGAAALLTSVVIVWMLRPAATLRLPGQRATGH